MQEGIVKRAIELYKAGSSQRKVANILGFGSHSTIGRCLNKNNIIKRTQSEACRKYKVNHNFFKVIDKEDKAYWLGFIAADGCIQRRGNSKIFSITLSNKDKGHIVLLSKTLSSNYPLYYRGVIHKTGILVESWTLQFNSREIFDDLMDKGITPRKSLTLKPPKNIPYNLISHWIRGYFDGDGTVYTTKKNHLRVKIVSTKKVLEFIQDKLEGIGNIRSNWNSKAFSLVVGSQKDTKKFFDYIYKDASVFMRRKKKVFDLNFEEKRILKKKKQSTVGNK